ncbi:MAG: M1 family metallopeptidase [Pirellulaceae bacterium]
MNCRLVYRSVFVARSVLLVTGLLLCAMTGEPIHAALQEAPAAEATKEKPKQEPTDPSEAEKKAREKAAREAARNSRAALESELAALRDRAMAPRKDENIFSPLDLPAPSSMRTVMGLPGPDYWQQRADYQIEATLDAEKDAIQAKSTITYANNSPHPLPFLWMTLEQNLFREDSDGSKFTPPGSRFNNREGFNGGYKIDFVKVNGQDRQLQVFDTLGRIDLETPLAPKGGKATIEVSWSFNIPEYGADRLGISESKKGKVYELAQWFPAICKFDDVNGWNTMPYLGQGEFYTDYGSYEVKLSAPRTHVVCATGELKNPQEVLSPTQLDRWNQAKTSKETVMIRGPEDIGKPEMLVSGEGNLTWHFKADQVRTFAWTSSAATVWDAASIKWEDGQAVFVQSVYPEESSAWTESTQMLRRSILHYSDMWFRYPYPTAINVNGICGGMEYPMIIFCGSDRDRLGLHGVTSHEIGHTWFPMVVNTDERRYPWMDEGFNTFINNYDRFDHYERDVLGKELPEQTVERRRVRRDRRRGALVSQPLNLPADQIKPQLLGRLAYFKTGSAMQTLRETVLGPDRFDPAFRLYIREWAFKSPQPADFFRCMENAAGANLAWYWRGWFMEDVLLDQAIATVDVSRDKQNVRIQISNREEMVMPVLLEVEFEDGSITSTKLPVFVWHYTNVWQTQVPTEGKKVVRVTLDPEIRMPDADRSNNTWTAPEEDSGS